MTPRLFALPLLSLALGCVSANAQPTYKSHLSTDYKVPAADLEKWATRLRKRCPREGWTVKVEGNDVLIARDKRAKPLRFRQVDINTPPGSPLGQRPYYEDEYLLKLQFSPLMTQARYEELLAENEVTDREKNILKRKYKITERFGDYYAFTDQEKAAKQAYFEESKKLVFHTLPHFYTPEYSITFVPACGPFHYLDSGDNAVDEECNHVEEEVSSYFGEYDKLAIYPQIVPLPVPSNPEARFPIIPANPDQPHNRP